jgi:hypothetical protein
VPALAGRGEDRREEAADAADEDQRLRVLDQREHAARDRDRDEQPNASGAGTSA